METVLAWTAVVACVGWGVAIWLWMNLRGEKVAANITEKRYVDCLNKWNQDKLRGDEIQCQYDRLIDSLKQKALTAPRPQPKVKTWAGIRKANEAAIRKEDELNEKRERDTAFAE